MNPAHPSASPRRLSVSLLARWPALLALLGLTGVFAAVVFAYATPPSAAAPAAPPLFDNLGTHSRPITTSSPQAQRYFDQGLRFLFGFNHGMAVRSFEAAVAFDPECAMAHWGVAVANGPHINFPLVPPPQAEKAWKHLTLARQFAARGTPAEQGLIAALGHRYASPQPEARRPLDEAYADAMRKLWWQFPKDEDIGAFFAESLMNLRPWDQWTPDGVAQPGTDEVIKVLDAVLALNGDHPFANHLYIHAVEASPHPERALAAADRLRALQPGLAHNVHMPSHIDIRVGDWHKAVVSNLKAIEADQAYRKVVGPPRDLVVLYAAHNRHMLAYAAMMTGQRELSLKHIREMVAEIPADFMKEWAVAAEGFAAMPFEVLVRFGLWDEILAEPDNYPDHMPFTKALRHGARAIAFAAKGDVASARRAQARYVAMAATIPAEATLGNNALSSIIAVATPMIEGEILVREGRLDEGFAALRAAIAAEDQLRYDEPPGWILPVRHALGANLMAHGRYAEAEAVYREDLKRLPNNGWSLLGLSEALAKQQNEREAGSVLARFATVWRDADVTITSSCFCQPGAE